jgi:PAS domain S-box-containing protein
MRQQSGKCIYIHLALSLLKGSDGRIIEMLGYAMDITAHTEAEKKLRESEARYRQLADLLPVAVYTCQAPGGILQYYNQQAVELWGQEPVCGDSNEQFCGYLKLYQKNGSVLPYMQAPMAIALNQGISYHNQEVIIERPDGSQIIALANIDPVKNQEGEIIESINVLQDITHLKRAEEALRNSEARYRALFDGSPLGILMLNPANLAFVEFNDQAHLQLGYSRKEFAQLTLQDIEAAPSPEKSLKYACYLMRGLGINKQEFETQYWTKTGETRDVLVTGRPLSIDDYTYFCAVFQDITERKWIEKTLKEADQRKNEFLALLAHELRNPLVPIRNAVRLLTLQSDPVPPHLQQICALIDRQLNYLTHLVDDLLDIARITRGQLILQKKPCDIISCVEQAVEVIRPVLDEKGHDLILKLPSSPLLIEADPVRLVQVVENLLHNAVKYTKERGKIVLTVAQQEQQAVLTVADNGVGIPTELLPHIFDHFSYIERPLKHRHPEGGLGLGLSLTKSLVEMHNGQISAASPGSDQGSTFTIQLPLTNDSSQPAIIPVTDASSTASSCHRVLIVDDNKDITHSFEILLSVWGHEVQTAFDGPTALEIVRTFQPEIALLDIGLPGMNGYEIARRLRAEYGQRIKLIALTGYGQEQDKARAKEAGFDYHLTKPPQLEVLKDLLA